MSNIPGQHYKASGKFSPFIVLGAPLFMLVSFIAALIYAYLNVYIPITGWVTFIFIIGYIFVTCTSSVFILKMFNVRSTMVILLWSAFACFMALYMDWACFVNVVINRYAEEADLSLADTLLSPVALWDTICAIAESGWYSMGSSGKSNVSGWVLWGLWGVEAVAICGANFFIAFSTLDDVFCEKCNQWADENDSVLNFCHDNEEFLVRAFSTNDIRFSEHIKPMTPNSKLFYTIRTSICSSCNEFVYLSLSNTRITLNKEGEEESSNTELVTNLCFSIDDFKQLAVNITSVNNVEEEMTADEELEVDVEPEGASV